MEKKKCTKCGEVFNNTPENFHRRKTSPDGFNTICKNCNKFCKPRSHKHWEDNKLLCLKCNIYKDPNCFSSHHKKIHRRYKDTICKDCRKIQYDNRKVERLTNSTLSRLLTERFLSLKERAKKTNLELDFNKFYLHKLWEVQEGRCAVSNLPMTYQARMGRISTNVSVDRINSKGGYTKNNIQLVCMAVNQMKNDLTMDELIYFCTKIIENNVYKHKKIA